MLAVTNDQIRPPINIENRRNKQTFDTYAYTIDLVPLVLEETCFAGLHLNTSGKPSKRRNQAKRKADSRNQILKSQAKAHLRAQSRLSTTKGAT
jgi:hypothetical protein